MPEKSSTSLKNKKIIITGATSGIGFATALSFARYGALVVVSGRDETRGEQLIQEIKKLGGKGKFIRADFKV